MTSNPYGMREGSIEQHTDYKPEMLGATDFVAGEPEQTWDDYCIELVPVEANGRDTGKRAIMRNGEFLSMVSEQYRLLPNEHAVSVADGIADELGAVPFSDFGGDWYIKLDEHVFQDPEGRRAHALYAWDDPVDLTGNGEEIQLGFAVHNSIDASMGFRVGLFTFRHACANMVFMGIDRSGMSFDQRDVINFAEQRHTMGLDVDNLRAFIEDTIQFGPMVIDAYQSWVDEDLTSVHAMRLLEQARDGYLSRRYDLPTWLQDAYEQIEEADQRARENETLNGVHQNGLPEEARANIVEAHMPKGEAVWDTYNDLTANIWHNDSTGDQTKIQKMGYTHRAFPIQTQTDDATITIQ